jgi:molybdopterin molybdotransferase
MLSLPEAVARVLADVPLLPVEVVPLSDAYDRVLAGEVRAVRDVPPWDNSAMDGYAVRASDLRPGVLLDVEGEVAAGDVPQGRLCEGRAVRIFTGASVPSGADTVVIQEHTERVGSSVRVLSVPPSGANIRRRGQDVQTGAVLVEAGVRLSPGALGLVASQGLADVQVRRQPVIALLATGDELALPGQPLGPGQIYASNAVALAGLVRSAGGVPRDHGVARDALSGLCEALTRAAEGADAVVTTGGVSVGDHDLVKPAIARLGGEMDFWKVAIKPGKPLAWGSIPSAGRRVPVFGLPGNPVSAVVNFLQVVHPWIGHTLGCQRPFLPVVEATAAERLVTKAGRAKLLRVRLEVREGRWWALSTGSQSSGVLSSIARAHGLALIPPGEAGRAAGEAVRVQLMDRDLLDRADPGYGW